MKIPDGQFLKSYLINIIWRMLEEHQLIEDIGIRQNPHIEYRRIAQQVIGINSTKFYMVQAICGMQYQIFQFLPKN